MSTTFDRVRRVICEALRKPESSVGPETDLKHGLCVDSLDRLQIAFDLEDEFGLEFGDFELEPSQETVGDVVATVDLVLAKVRGSITSAI